MRNTVLYLVLAALFLIHFSAGFLREIPASPSLQKKDLNRHIGICMNKKQQIYLSFAFVQAGEEMEKFPCDPLNSVV